jgi:hypothetical protein
MSGTIISFIIQLVAGAIGGNAAGGLLKNISLGPLGPDSALHPGLAPCHLFRTGAAAAAAQRAPHAMDFAEVDAPNFAARFARGPWDLNCPGLRPWVATA